MVSCFSVIILFLIGAPPRTCDEKDKVYPCLSLYSISILDLTEFILLDGKKEFWVTSNNLGRKSGREVKLAFDNGVWINWFLESSGKCE